MTDHEEAQRGLTIALLHADQAGSKAMVFSAGLTAEKGVKMLDHIHEIERHLSHAKGHVRALMRAGGRDRNGHLIKKTELSEEQKAEIKKIEGELKDFLSPPCTNPGGHKWPADVEERDRWLCIHCGADGDA